ncbi:MAG TPA: retropepsin-like aspartic protease [Candidatus Elarobacter sp.]|jgi:predicted aspartyl protease
MIRPIRGGALAAAAILCAVVPPPARAAESTCVPAQLASASYPVLLVKVRVNGRGPYTFFVDTGATVTIVNTSLARRLHLAPLPVSVQGIGAGGAFSTRASVASIDVGDAHQDRVLVATYDLSQINAAVGPTDGGLGYNFLKAYRVTIDYPGRRVCFEP